MLKHRVATGVSVAAFFLALFAFGPYWMLLILLLAVFVLAQTEYREVVEGAGYSLPSRGMLVCGLLYLVAVALETATWRCRHPGLVANWTPPPSEAVLWLTPAVLLTLEVLRRQPERAMERFGLSLVGFWYVAGLLGFMARIGFGWPAAAADGSAIWTGRLVLAYFVLVVKLGDVGAYTLGMLFGRGGRKLIPEISPAKSVVGLGGAYLGATLASLLVGLLARWLGDGRLGGMRLPLGHALAIGLMLATVGVLGDLAESLFKRALRVKDSSGRFPGMGGFLDVIDSLLFSAPFMYFYVSWFLS